jgi:hypothetical protein
MRHGVLVDLGVGFGLVAAAGEALDMDDVAHAPARRRALDRDDQVDGLADHLAHRLLADLGGELLEAAQRRHGVLEWMVVTPPGWPVFQALRSVSAAPSRTSPTMMRSGAAASCSSEAAPCRSCRCMQRHGVLRRALDLGGVLEDDHAIVRRGLDDLGDDGIGERRLARAGAARDDDVERDAMALRMTRPVPRHHLAAHSRRAGSAATRAGGS